MLANSFFLLPVTAAPMHFLTLLAKPYALSKMDIDHEHAFAGAALPGAERQDPSDLPRRVPAWLVRPCVRRQKADVLGHSGAALTLPIGHWGVPAPDVVCLFLRGCLREPGAMGDKSDGSLLYAVCTASQASSTARAGALCPRGLAA